MKPSPFQLLIFLPLIGALSCASERRLLRRVDLTHQVCSPFETRIGGVTTLGEIRGTVSPEGEPIGLPDVDLILRRLGTADIVARVRSDASGHFEFPVVPADVYQLETCLGGFDSLVHVVRLKRGLSSDPLALALPLSM